MKPGIKLGEFLTIVCVPNKVITPDEFVVCSDTASKGRMVVVYSPTDTTENQSDGFNQTPTEKVIITFQS